MIKLNVIGPWFGSSGYVAHTKGLALALNKLCDVKVTTQLFQGWESQSNDEEFLMLSKADSRDRINLIIDLPFNWSFHASKEKNIGFLVWEGDKIPVSWINQIANEKIIQVWCPSEHTLRAIRNTLNSNLHEIEARRLMQKVRIVPHGVDHTLFYPNQTLPSNTAPHKTFVFLMNKGFRSTFDRGGVQYGIRAFLQEFKKGEATLLLKVNPAYAMPMQEILNFIQKNVGDPQTAPEIKISMENLPYSSLRTIYQQADVFISPTRGEAFSLPCLEAMACGKPCITTNFGGQTDYVTNTNGWLVPFSLSEVKHEVMYEGIQWATPNIDELRKIMRYCYEHRDEVNQKGEQAVKDASALTWHNSALKSVEYLKERGAL